MLKPENTTHSNEDPLVRSARREAVVTLLAWLAAATYTVGYCWRFAYNRPPESLHYYWGIPDWVLWGIIAPWAVCVIGSWWFAYIFMRDEPLGPEREDPEDALL